MRFLKRQSISRNGLTDSRVAVDIFDGVIMDTTNSLLFPRGLTIERPNSPVNGMIRYNSDTGEVEVYQGDTWRALRYKEAVGITQQQLGIGDNVELLFGPLNPAPPTIVETNSTWSGANLIVVVDTVWQLYNTHYVITENPPGKSSGWYIEFDEPVPLGKTVTVLHGFDR